MEQTTQEKLFLCVPRHCFIPNLLAVYNFFCPSALVPTCRESVWQQRERRRCSGGALLLTKGRRWTPCDLPFFPPLVCLRLTITELLGRRIEISVTMLLAYLPTTSTQLLPQGYRPHHTCNHALTHARTQHAHNHSIAQTHSNRKSTNAFLSAKSQLTLCTRNNISSLISLTQTHRDTATHMTFPIFIFLAQTQTQTHTDKTNSHKTHTHTHTRFLSMSSLYVSYSIILHSHLRLSLSLLSLSLFCLSLSLSL
jgi:hypothetical protein